MMRVPCVRKRNTNGGGSAFSPSGISGLFERWVADQAYMTMDGSNNVSSWAGAYAGRTLAQATGGQQPNWTSALAAANNKPAVQFTAANSDELNDAGTTDYNFMFRTDTGTGSTWTGCYYSADSSGNPIAGIGADGTKPRHILYSYGGGAWLHDLYYAGTRIGYQTYSASATPAVNWFVISRTQGTGAGLITGSGSDVFGSWTSLASIPADTSTPTRGVRLGRSGGSYGSSSWLELSLYTRPLTAGEMAQLGTYYASTYGARP